MSARIASLADRPYGSRQTGARQPGERLAIVLASVAMAAVLGVTLAPREAFGLLPLSAAPAQLHSTPQPSGGAAQGERAER